MEERNRGRLFALCTYDFYFLVNTWLQVRICLPPTTFLRGNCRPTWTAKEEQYRQKIQIVSKLIIHIYQSDWNSVIANLVAILFEWVERLWKRILWTWWKFTYALYISALKLRYFRHFPAVLSSSDDKDWSATKIHYFIRWHNRRMPCMLTV